MSQAGLTSPAAHHAYSFSGFLLDLERETLLRDGAEIRLRPKAFEMLRYLAAHAETLVTKEQLLDTVWGDTVVTESSLSQCLAEIRRALEDEDKTLVRTVPRRGVILDTPVTEHAPAPERPGGDVAVGAEGPGGAGPLPVDATGSVHAPAAGTADSVGPTLAGAVPPVAQTAAEPVPERRDDLRSRWRMAFPLLVAGIGLALWWTLPDRAGTSAVPSAASVSGVLPLSVAVLPFADLSESGDQEWFGDGMAEEIINLLVRSDDLQVIARTSSFSFKNQPGATVETIARALNVAYVLEGSVRRDGDRVRVTAQLIDAADSTHLWSRAYDRPVDDLFETQISIAGAVADALHVKLVPPEADRVWARSVDPRSYQSSLEGRYFYHRRASGDLDRARELLEEAVALDPDNAAAWMYLAGAYYLKVHHGDMSAAEGAIVMGEAVDRAMLLAPDDAEVLVRASQLARLRGDRDRAWRDLQRARELGPENWLVLGLFAGQALRNLDFETALRLQRRSAELDPLSPLVRGNLAYFLLMAGHFEEAEAEAIGVSALSPAKGAVMDRVRADSLLLRGRPAAALAFIDDRAAPLDRKSGDDAASWISVRAMSLHALGRSDEALKEMARLAEVPTVFADMGNARFHAFIGDADGAFAALDRLAAAQSGPMDSAARPRSIVATFRASPFLRPLHGDPRWARFMEASEDL